MRLHLSTRPSLNLSDLILFFSYVHIAHPSISRMSPLKYGTSRWRRQALLELCKRPADGLESAPPVAGPEAGARAGAAGRKEPAGRSEVAVVLLEAACVCCCLKGLGLRLRMIWGGGIVHARRSQRRNPTAGLTHSQPEHGGVRKDDAALLGVVSLEHRQKGPRPRDGPHLGQGVQRL